jgi:putative membrane protein
VGPTSRLAGYRQEGDIMIHGYSDHAANERTFLAWMRTGIAVVVFGFVVEKFNLFLLALGHSALAHDSHPLRMEELAGPLGRYEGLAFIVAGLALMVAATVRYVRTERRLNDAETHPAGDVRIELTVSAVLVLLIAGLGTYLAVI